MHAAAHWRTLNNLDVSVWVWAENTEHCMWRKYLEWDKYARYDSELIEENVNLNYLNYYYFFILQEKFE